MTHGPLRNIAVTIFTDGNEVLLRDEQGYPLWRTHRVLRIGPANQTTPLSRGSEKDRTVHRSLFFMGYLPLRSNGIF
jgi:hypothetical protein